MTPEREQQLFDDVGAIKRAVIGDEPTGQVGLVKRVGALEVWRDKWQIKTAGVVGGAGVVGVLLKYLWDKI